MEDSILGHPVPLLDVRTAPPCRGKSRKFLSLEMQSLARRPYGRHLDVRVSLRYRGHYHVQPAERQLVTLGLRQAGLLP